MTNGMNKQYLLRRFGNPQVSVSETSTILVGWPKAGGEGEHKMPIAGEEITSMSFEEYLGKINYLQLTQVAKLIYRVIGYSKYEILLDTQAVVSEKALSRLLIDLHSVYDWRYRDLGGYTAAGVAIQYGLDVLDSNANSRLRMGSNIHHMSLEFAKLEINHIRAKSLVETVKYEYDPYRVFLTFALEVAPKLYTMNALSKSLWQFIDAGHKDPV